MQSYIVVPRSPQTAHDFLGCVNHIETSHKSEAAKVHKGAATRRHVTSRRVTSLFRKRTQLPLHSHIPMFRADATRQSDALEHQRMSYKVLRTSSRLDEHAEAINILLLALNLHITGQSTSFLTPAYPCGCYK